MTGRVRTRGNFNHVYWAIALVLAPFFGVIVGGWILGPEPIFNHPWGGRVFGGLSACFFGMFWALKTAVAKRIGKE